MKRFVQILLLTMLTAILYAQVPIENLVPTLNVNVTFRVDMSDKVISPLGVHIAGTFNSWNPAATLMTQSGTTTVYEVTLSLVPGETVQFKYINGNAWGYDEMVPGDCGLDNGYNSYNRYLLIPGTDTIMAVVCFGLCHNQCDCGTIIKSIGPAPSDYISINAALIDIKAHGICGTLILELKSDYVSTVEATFPIPFASLPNSSTHPLIIRPQAGATGLSITSANTTGTINIDRAHYIIFDGRPGGTGSSQLTISNTSTTGYSIQFINNATYNTVQYCTITGRNTLTYSGVVNFSSTNQPEGNSFNKIDQCNIRDGSSTPTNLIYSSGTITSYNTQNNNNTISNCNLFNWFNASLINAAINIVGGTSDWMITGNSFYQTASRTFNMTSATDVGAIFVTSNEFGYNFTISNNYFGGTAPQCGGGAMTWYGSGTTGSFTPRILRFSTANGPFNNITSNTFANMAFTSSSSSTGYGLIQTQGGNANISDNTFGSQTATSNITCTFGGTTTSSMFLLLAFGYGTTSSVNNVTNNNIGGITLNATSGGSVSFRVIYCQALAGSTFTISNNLVGGTVANSIQQNTNNLLAGILTLNPSIGNVITNNVVRNLTRNNTGSNGPVFGIDVEASGGNHTITGNQVYNLTTNSTITNINNYSSIVGICMIGNAIGGTNVSNNTIYNLSNTNTTVAGWINGMYFSTAVAPQPQTTISNNFIHSIRLASSTAGMTGIFIPNNGTGLVYNNLIRLGLTSAGASITTPLKIVGIYKGSWGNVGVYHNSVYIGGTGVTGSVNTYAYLRDAAGFADTVMNNILYNARSNSGTGTGKHFGIGSHINTLIACDNNNIYTNGSGGYYGVCAGTNYTDLSAWRSGTTLDQNSISTNPLFVAPGTVVPDLHLATGSPCEGGGKLISNVIKDYDGQVRSGLTPVDIGADAGNFGFPLDIGAVALFSPAATGCYSSNEDVIITIRNYGSSVIDFSLNNVTLSASATGPNPIVFAPVIINSGTLDPNSTQNVTVSMIYDMSAIGTYVFSSSAVVSGDGNPGNDAMTQASRKVTPPMGGLYHVGTAGDYPTLTDAVAAYNNCNCINGSITFSLTDATYPYESYPITINGNGCASPVNTLTIKPDPGVTALLSGSVSGGPVVRLKTARYVCIDGSNIPGGTSRDLTIKNTSSSNPNVIVFNSFSTTPVSQCELKNCVIVNGANNQSTVVACDATILYDWGYFYDLSITNNEVRKGYHAIYIRGGFASNNINIGGNKLNSSGSDAIFHGGIYVQGVDGGNIYNNDIANFETATAEDDIGIWLATNSKNVNVFSNNIHSLRYTGTSGFAAWGMKVTTGMANAGINIYNNLIYDITGPGNDYSGSYYVDNPYGILLFTNQTGINIYYNSINLYGNTLNYANAMSACIFVGTGSFVNVRDNIIVNNLGLISAYGYGAVGIFAQSGNSQFTDIDYNDYYVNPAGYGVKAIGKISANSPALTLGAWQAETGKDTHSLNVNPLFTSNSNLIPQPASPVIGAALPLPGVVDNDYTGNSRGSVTTPGGYELISPASPSALTWTGSVNNSWHNPYNWNGISTIPDATTDVTIPAGLTYYPTLSNYGACKNIFLGSTAASTATLLDKNFLSVNGTATVQRYFSGNDIDWHLVSTPVSGATANVFLDMYMQSFSESANSFTQITDPLTSLNVMEGYGLYSDLSSDNTVTFSGNLNLGPQSKGFTDSNSGWNLLGNPYVSSIDWETVTIPSGMSNEVHYIDAATGNDLSYVKVTGGAGSRYIPPMQGFFVSATGSGTFSLDNAQRTHTGANTFYKSGNPQLLILEASGRNYSDQAWIHFNDQAGVEHDGVYDAYKRITTTNPSLPQIFSVTPSGAKLSINGMPETSVVPVGFTTAQSGDFTISAVETSEFNHVFLEDLFTGSFTDLLAHSYPFTFTSGDKENRFMLHFYAVSVDESQAELVNIYSSEKVVYVSVPVNGIGEVKILNMLGQQVKRGKIFDDLTRITLDEPGIYIVQASVNGRVYIKKVIIL
jgi:hypothetical protein